MFDVAVIGAGPAGVLAALRAADLGARTALIARAGFGGMAENDGPVPVRVLAHAARLMRDLRQLNQYGINVSDPILDYSLLLSKVNEIVSDVCSHSSLREQLDALGVAIFERAGLVRFVDEHTLAAEDGLQLQANKIILCTGGVSRKLPIQGFELTSTHSDAWALASVPKSMLVVGAGATGAQVASIFNAFGTRVHLFEAGPRILATEDEDVSAAVAAAFRASGIAVRENFGTIESFEKVPSGVRMNFNKDNRREDIEATLAVVAVGWVANTESLNLSGAGIELDQRKFVKVNEYMQTSSPHVFAAGDITGQLMLVPQAIRGGFVAATNAVLGPSMPLGENRGPTGSFTEPEYAQVGLTEARAREGHEVIKAVVNFDSTTRTLIDGRKFGFCKLLADRQSSKILGCHVVGERAVDITQVAAVAIAAGMRVDALAQIPLAYPTYAAILVRAAIDASGKLGLETGWRTQTAPITVNSASATVSE
ncbi:dihydrolipoyl dehydrogenase family protein [Rhizobium mesoamericanum]|uniref:dihydrolipoyl dehydrogenase family protein n=1 Tax=Rhizobium mesoamericanum TaxID=1079800 RepID=UPI000423DFBB|nr:NAD(P)/FAD-dependent oxidoreductase [Rhizobium mesoamericanum]